MLIYAPRCLTVPGSCKLISTITGRNNISVKLQVSGTPSPRFSASYPWHQLSFGITNIVNVSRPTARLKFQIIGQLTQFVTSGAKRETYIMLCVANIGKCSKQTL